MKLYKNGFLQGLEGGENFTRLISNQYFRKYHTFI